LQALNTVSGAGGLIKRGPGTLQFWGFGPNTYGGGTTVAAGTLEAGRVSQVSIPGAVVIGDDSTPTNTATLRVDREQQFSPAANVNVHTSGNLYLNDIPTLGTPVPTIGALSGGGTVYLGANSSLTVNNTVSNLFSGLISGPGIFNKSGIGLLRLTADNTYSGTTTVSAGTLQVDGSQPLSAVQLNSSARLQGVGTVGAITASGNSSVVAPGDSPGILTCSNYSASSVGGAGGLEIQLNGATPGLNYDQLNVRGTVSITGKVNLNASLNFSSWLSNSFTIIKNDGVDAVTGTFNGLAQGATLTIGAQQFQISYTGGDGNDVVLTQITGFPRPTLSIQQALAGSVRVLWQTNDPAYTLQSNTNLSTTNWTTVSPPPVISGSNYIVTNSLSAPLMFYRLSKP
jgi:autotransporter-associated beta strand protein